MNDYENRIDALMSVKSNKKNVLIIVSDALSEYFIDKKIDDEYVCPFLHKLGEENIYFTEMYSQAPYTMSAIQPLLSGVNVMDVNSYDAVLSNDSHSIFREFIDDGYRLYMTEYGSFFTPKDVVEHGKHFFMEFNWSISSIKPFLLYYIEKIENNDVNKDYYTERLNDCISKVFDSISAMYGYETTNADNIFVLSDEANVPDNGLRKKFASEYEKYKRDSRSYIAEMVVEKETHVFFSLDRELDPNICNKADLQRFYQKHKKVFNRIRRKEFVINCFCKEAPLKEVIRLLIFKSQKSLFGTRFKNKVVNFVQRIKLGQLSYDEYIRDNYRKRGIPSADYQLNKIYNAIKEDNKDGKPFFCYAHVMDTHQPFNFFTGEDVNKADEEIKLMSNIVKKIKRHDYKGSLSYLMAARYVDLCVERFVKNMDESGLLKNTVLVFTADHGLPYGDSPLREMMQGDNYHFESYHVPMIIADYSEPKTFRSDKMVSSLDFIPTIIDISGGKGKTKYLGHSIFEDYDRGYVRIEWMGSGVPDINNKPVVYGIRNKKLFLVAKANISDKLIWDNVECIYDLKDDPQEKYNVKDKFKNNKDVKEMLSILSARHDEVCSKRR